MSSGNNQRGGFGTKIGFIMAAAGSAVGLGNLWKFPYLTGAYGGGVFLITYLFILAIVAVPVVMGETAMGRYAKTSSVSAYEKIALKCGKTKWWSIVGFLGVLACFAMFAYYSVVGGWVTSFFFKSITTGLPSGEAATEAFNTLVSGTWQPILWHVVFLGVSMAIVLRGISGGIEKAGNFMMPALFVMLLIVVARSLTLPGAMEGVIWMFKPDFSKFNSEMIMAALGQVFFSVSLGIGALITYGSYMKGDENIVQTSIIVPVLDTAVAILAGLAILPAVFAFGFEPGQGPGLLFVTVPSIFASFGLLAGRLFGIIFFLLALFAALTTSIAMIEIPAAFFIDKLGWSRKKAVWFIGAVTFVLGIFSSLAMGPWADKLIFGLNFFDLMDAVSAKILMPVGGLLMAVFVGYVWKPESAVPAITNNGQIKFGWFGFWKICMKIVIPILIICIFLSGFGVIK